MVAVMACSTVNLFWAFSDWHIETKEKTRPAILK
jgi:hypothetical protein